nr:ribosomal protein L32 [Viola prionantha]
MRVPKKNILEKKYFEKNKGCWAVLKAFSLAKSLSNFFLLVIHLFSTTN